MKARVEIFYKNGVFDPQGHTVSESLKRLGFEAVDSVRMGKIIDLDLKTSNEEEAQKQVTQMCETLLANPVIESYTINCIN